MSSAFAKSQRKKCGWKKYLEIKKKYIYIQAVKTIYLKKAEKIFHVNVDTNLKNIYIFVKTETNGLMCKVRTSASVDTKVENPHIRYITIHNTWTLSILSSNAIVLDHTIDHFHVWYPVNIHVHILVYHEQLENGLISSSNKLNGYDFRILLLIDLMIET